jgi:acyl-CoA thioesterase-1
MRYGLVFALLLTGACSRASKDGSADDTARTAPAANGEPSVVAAPADSTTNAPGHSAVRVPTVLFIGTSLTAGLGLDPDSAYPRLLQRRADSMAVKRRFVNAGLSGETSAGALRRVDWLLRGEADVVVLETGANDGLRGLDVDSTARNIRSIVQRIRAAKPGATILLVQMEAPPNLGERYTTRFHDMYATIAREERIRLVPFLLDRVAGVARLNQADGVHPNDAGERIVADNVWRALKPVLDSLDRGGPVG